MMQIIHKKSMKPGVALVTGGAKRIGREIIKSLALDGWKTIIHYNTNNIAAKNLKKEVEKNKGKAAIIKCDLNRSSDVEKLIKRAEKKFGTISVSYTHLTLPTNREV